MKKILQKWIRSVRFWLLMLVPLSGVLTLAAKNSTDFAECYYTCCYQYMAWIFHNITGLLPFSLGEILVLTVPFALAGYVIYTVTKVRKTGGKTVLKAFLNLMCTASAVLFLFTANCGMNYYRRGVGEQMGIDTKPVSAEELYQTCVYLAEKASEIREQLSEDDKGVMVLSEHTEQKAAKYVSELLGNHLSQPKSVMLSRGMSYLNITGVYFPFTFEANVNTDIPAFTIPSTMCHELAHVSGIMHEEDANFMAFLSCIESEDKEFAYSGYTMAMIYAFNALYENDRGRYETLSGVLSDGVQRDLSAQSAYWKEFETPVAEVAANINDSYLKSNSQEAGVKSYGKMVDLTIAFLKEKILEKS